MSATWLRSLLGNRPSGKDIKGGLGEAGGGKSCLTNRAYGEEMNREYKGWISTSNIREHQGGTGNPTVDYNGCAGAFMDEGLTVLLLSILVHGPALEAK